MDREQEQNDVTAAEATDGDLAELRERVAAVVTTSTAGYADVELDPAAWTAADMDRLLDYAHTRSKITAAEAGLLRYLLRQITGSSAAPPEAALDVTRVTQSAQCDPRHTSRGGRV